MSNAVQAQHPAVVLRSNYQHLRALLAIALAVILALTIAVVVLATSNSSNRSTVISPTTAAMQANPPAETGAKLDHTGRNAAIAQPTDRLANYPDAPQPSVTTPQPRLSNYPDAPQP